MAVSFPEAARGGLGESLKGSVAQKWKMAGLPFRRGGTSRPRRSDRMMLRCMSLDVAQNRHAVVTRRCPLWRAKPTWRIYEYTPYTWTASATRRSVNRPQTAPMIRLWTIFPLGKIWLRRGVSSRSGGLPLGKSMAGERFALSEPKGPPRMAVCLVASETAAEWDHIAVRRPDDRMGHLDRIEPKVCHDISARPCRSNSSITVSVTAALAVKSLILDSLCLEEPTSVAGGCQLSFGRSAAPREGNFPSVGGHSK
jgi:hypothetical protein